MGDKTPYKCKHKNKGKQKMPKLDKCSVTRKLMLTEEKADMYVVLYHYKLRKYKCPHCHMWHTSSRKG